MKKLSILLLSFLAIALVACDRNDTPNRGQLDPNAMILIRPAAGVRAQHAGLTALEIVEQGMSMNWQSHYVSNDRHDEPQTFIGRGFTDAQRCFDTPALKMWGIDIINITPEYPDGRLLRDFIYAFNVYITGATLRDTIAYIPNSVINAARPLIIAAWNDRNYNEVYRLFDEAFTFLPISE